MRTIAYQTRAALATPTKYGYQNPDDLAQQASKKLAYQIRVAQFTSLEKRNAGLKDYEVWKAMFPDMFSAIDGKTPAVSETSGQKLAVVYSCLNVLGETYGSLPCDLKQTTASGKVTLATEWLHYLVHDRPNPYTTAFDFWSTQQKLRKAWGNAYTEIERDRYNQPLAFWILHPAEVQLSQSADGTVYYNHKGRQIPYTNVLHFKNYSTNGFTGISSIRQNALTMGLALKLKQYNSSIIGERPYGYLTSPTRPKDLQAKENMRGQWTGTNDEKNNPGPKTYNLSGNVNGIPLLYGGLEFKPLTLPADDVQYIESAKLSEREIYGIFRMPPTMVQDWEKAPYNSSEQQDIVFAKYTLADLRGVEQELNEKLLPESNKTSTEKKYFKFNLQGLLRGDTASRIQLYRTLVNLSAMSPKQVADYEDLPTDGVSDQYYMQLNMVPTDLLAEVQKAKAGKVQAPIDDDTRSALREEFLNEMRQRFESVRSQMNGHAKFIADILDE